MLSENSIEENSIEENSIEENSIDNTHNFKKPTIDEIESYCQERNNNVNANRFYDFYESKGWMVGKNKMKDWKASVRAWEKEIKKDNVPEWFDKDIKQEDLTEKVEVARWSGWRSLDGQGSGGR